MLSSDWIGFGFPRASTSRSLNCHLTLNDVRAGTLDPFCLTSRPSWLVSKKLADSVLIKGEISKTRRTFRRSIWKRTFLAREKRPTSNRKSPSLFWKIEIKGWLHSCRDFLSITVFHLIPATGGPARRDLGDLVLSRNEAAFPQSFSCWRDTGIYLEES